MSSVGDVVLTEPVTALLREAYPRAEIAFVVKAGLVDLVAGNPYLDAIHLLREGSLAGVRALGREVRERGYDAVVDLHANFRSRYLAGASGARLVTRYRKREVGDAYRVRVRKQPFRASKRLVERYVASLIPLGVEPVYRRPRYHVAEADREWAEEYLKLVGIPPGGFAVVVPGSVWATKRWPAERYGALVRRVNAELGLPVLLLGSAGERELCESIASPESCVACAPSARVAAGETTLGQMAALIALARAYVGNDSGPTHIAMAAGTPTVAVFGPTDPGQFDFEGHALVYADLECSACSFFGGDRCRLSHWNCMRTVEVDDVFEAFEGLLGPIAADGARVGGELRAPGTGDDVGRGGR
jgi:lipopolysaccharide heptosyltransferase II